MPAVIYWTLSLALITTGFYWAHHVRARTNEPFTSIIQVNPTTVWRSRRCTYLANEKSTEVWKHVSPPPPNHSANPGTGPRCSRCLMSKPTLAKAQRCLQLPPNHQIRTILCLPMQSCVMLETKTQMKRQDNSLHVQWLHSKPHPCAPLAKACVGRCEWLTFQDSWSKHPPPSQSVHYSWV